MSTTSGPESVKVSGSAPDEGPGGLVVRHRSGRIWGFGERRGGVKKRGRRLWIGSRAARLVADRLTGPEVSTWTVGHADSVGGRQ